MHFVLEVEAKKKKKKKTKYFLTPTFDQKVLKYQWRM